MSVLHRFCTENANGPHADPYYSTISPILSCFAQHATAFIFFIESSEYERDRFLHKDHIIIVIICPMAGCLKKLHFSILKYCISFRIQKAKAFVLLRLAKVGGGHLLPPLHIKNSGCTRSIFFIQKPCISLCPLLIFRPSTRTASHVDKYFDIF